MKNFKNYLSFLAVFALLFSSCSKDENTVLEDQQNATLTFGADLQGFANNMNKQQDVEECVEGDPAIAQIVLEYGGMEHEVFVSILGDEDGGYFTAFSEDLEIPVPSGSDYVMVELTDFVVWTDDDDDGEADRVLWVAPKAGSDYAQFVTNPLGGDDAYTWNLRAGSKTYTDVEVLCFDNRDVNRYGYQFFDIIATELQTFCVFANYCTDDGRHYTANYSLDLYTFTGDPSEERPTLDNSYMNIYSDEMPDPATMGDENGNYYADPLCLSVPMLDEGEYLYYEATVANWDGNYVNPDNHMVWGYISQADIDALVMADGDNNPETMDYLHLFFNCPEGDSVVVDPDPDPSDCVPQPGTGCEQIAESDQTVTPTGGGTVGELPKLILFDASDAVIGEIRFDFDNTTSLLTAYIDLNPGYVMTGGELNLDSVEGGVITDPTTAPVTLCLGNITEEDFNISWDLDEIEGLESVTSETLFPITLDYVLNICESSN